MKALCPLAVLCCFLLTSGAPRLAHAQTESVDREAAAQELMDLSRAWSAAAASGNVETVLSYWADDAVMMAPGQPPIRGNAAIRDYVLAMEDIPGFRIRWEPLEAHVSASGDLAYLIERNEITMTDSTGAPVTEYNKVVTVWERQPDGSWKNVVDMWNSDPTAEPTHYPTEEKEMADNNHRHHEIDYIEFEVTDMARSKSFYGAAFDWQFNDYGPDYAGIRKRQGGEAGGLWAQSEVSAGGPLVILYSNDLEATLARVREAGGQITKEPYEFPGGRRFHFKDPSGNELAVWSDK